MDLEKVEVKRCYKPDNFGVVKYAELYHFSDASQSGFGQSLYLGSVGENGQVCCSFVIGKSKMSEFVRSDISYQSIKEFYWTDSKVVLGYIKNESRRFHTYVANRVQQIHNAEDPDSWFYLESSGNPADITSRGITATELLHSSWLNCPEFLEEDILFDVNKYTTYSICRR